MPPRRPFGQEDIHHNSFRSGSSRSESIRHGSLSMSRRSPKLEVSFLLNQSQSAASSTNSGTGEHSRSRLPGQSVASSRSRSERRGPGGSSSGQRRYQCDFCSATFAQSHDLLKHKRFVTVLRVFQEDLRQNLYQYMFGILFRLN